jgi:hypothetical protein
MIGSAAAALAMTFRSPRPAITHLHVASSAAR